MKIHDKFHFNHVIDPFEEIEYEILRERWSTPHFWTWYCTTSLSIIISRSLEREKVVSGVEECNYRCCRCETDPGSLVLVLIGSYHLAVSLSTTTLRRSILMHVSRSTISYQEYRGKHRLRYDNTSSKSLDWIGCILSGYVDFPCMIASSSQSTSIGVMMRHETVVEC